MDLKKRSFRIYQWTCEEVYVSCLMRLRDQTTMRLRVDVGIHGRLSKTNTPATTYNLRTPNLTHLTSQGQPSWDVAHSYCLKFLPNKAVTKNSPIRGVI